MKKYFVLGGVYRDTTFREIVEKFTRDGPFDTYEAAKASWQAMSWANVDDCHARFTVVEYEE